MSLESGLTSFEMAHINLTYLRRRVRDEVQAAIQAQPTSARVIHVALATAYAERCSDEDQLSWAGQNRVW